MLSGFRDLAKKLIAQHNSFGKFCQLCCCCCFSEDLLLDADAPDGPKPTDLEGGGKGGGKSDPPPPTTPGRGKTPRGSPIAIASARGSVSGGGGGSTSNNVVIDDGQQPGSSTAEPPVEHTRHGTPLSSRLPPLSTKHPVNEETPAQGDTTGESGDVGFIEADEEPLCIAGKVLFSFTYIPGANKLNLKVVRVADLPPVERGGAEMVKIHLCVLPMRNQRFQTKQQTAKQGVFNQTFQFVHMTKDLLETCAIRLRVYGKEGYINKRLIGEAKIALAKVDLTSPLADGDMWKNLSPKGDVVSSLFLY